MVTKIFGAVYYARKPIDSKNKSADRAVAGHRYAHPCVDTKDSPESLQKRDSLSAIKSVR